MIFRGEFLVAKCAKNTHVGGTQFIASAPIAHKFTAAINCGPPEIAALPKLRRSRGGTWSRVRAGDDGAEGGELAFDGDIAAVDDFGVADA